MLPRIFIPQADIDEWVLTDRVELLGDALRVARTEHRLSIVAATFFRSVSGGAADEHGLVGKVKDEEALVAMGGETYMSSVVIGDVAYDVEPGFLATPLPAPGSDAARVIAAVKAMAG